MYVSPQVFDVISYVSLPVHNSMSRILRVQRHAPLSDLTDPGSSGVDLQHSQVIAVELLNNTYFLHHYI